MSSQTILMFAGILGLASAAMKGTNDYLRLQQQIIDDEASAKEAMYLSDNRNFMQKIPVTDCMYVTSQVGPFVYTAKSNDEVVCGIYFLTDPDRKIEVRFISFDVPCDQRGLVSFVDGWELNGEIFPSDADHQLSMKQRTEEFCGKSVKKTFVSSQNAALIQYRIPARGKGFTVIARYSRNLTPCNILSESLTDPFTLRNYGRRSNCTLSAIYPGIVRVVALNVGITNLLGPIRTLETGTLHNCDEKNLQDFVQVGGTPGLDTSKLDTVDSICGIDSKPDEKLSVEYGVTSVRLVSSGFFDNSVTVEIDPMINQEMLTNFNL